MVRYFDERKKKTNHDLGVRGCHQIESLALKAMWPQRNLFQVENVLLKRAWMGGAYKTVGSAQGVRTTGMHGRTFGTYLGGIYTLFYTKKNIQWRHFPKWLL